MAELDPISPGDTSEAAEAAYREALLRDDAGREARRVRLMAALPAAEPVPVAQATLAWRWQPYALGLLATGLLVAAVLALKGRPAEQVPLPADPRMVAAEAASAATVVAQAEPAVEPPPPTAPPRVAAKRGATHPRVSRPEPMVVADAASAQPTRQSEATEAEPASAPAVPPAAAPVMATAPSAKLQAEAADPAAAAQVERLTRVESPALSSALRMRGAASTANSLAASSVAEPAMAFASHARLLAAVNQGDVAAARAALQAGASAQSRDAQGRTALMLAARTGSRELVDLLLAAGARKGEHDPRGATAADHAAAQGHADLADALR